MDEDRPTILIVDDDESILHMLQQSLASTCNVLISTDGTKAVDMYHLGEDDVDLVLLDLGMPGISGYDALAELQMLDPDVKVAIITGLEPDEERLPGILGVLQKPFRPADVIELVRKVLAT